MKIEKSYFWPQWFSEALMADEQKTPGGIGRNIKPSDRDKYNDRRALILKLNRANLYLWRALNIYDDFLDNDGRPEKLPSANTYYRRFLEIYYRLNLRPDFYSLFNKILTDLDAANREETIREKIKIKQGVIVAPPRLPSCNLTSLARKSLALGLGPIAILSFLGYTAKDRKIKATLNFFRYALAAKQLSDDATDWSADLKKGVMTAANVLVLQAAKKRRLVLDLNRRPEVAHLLFVTGGAEKLAKQISGLGRLAKTEAAKIGLGAQSRLIKELITPLENAVVETENFRRILNRQ